MKDAILFANPFGLDHVVKGSREAAQSIMQDLDRAYANKLRRKARTVIYRTGRRSRRRIERAGVGVAEAYCPDRLTSVAAD